MVLADIRRELPVVSARKLPIWQVSTRVATVGQWITESMGIVNGNSSEERVMQDLFTVAWKRLRAFQISRIAVLDSRPTAWRVALFPCYCPTRLLFPLTMNRHFRIKVRTLCREGKVMSNARDSRTTGSGRSRWAGRNSELNDWFLKMGPSAVVGTCSDSQARWHFRIFLCVTHGQTKKPSCRNSIQKTFTVTTSSRFT